MTTNAEELLNCSCCGASFWGKREEHICDGDFGYCEKCLIWMEQKTNAMIDKVIPNVAQSLNPKNRSKFVAMSLEEQRQTTLSLIDRGAIGWAIQKS